MISQGQCTVFKKNLLSGLEDFQQPSPFIYKIALYTSNATLDNTTTVYTTTGEVTGPGYTAGGLVLTNPTVGFDTSNNVAYVDFDNAVWANSSLTARGALIYNSTTGAAVCVLDFGSDKSASPFAVNFTNPTSTTAIIRLS